jgi:hypothetical protein
MAVRGAEEVRVGPGPGSSRRMNAWISSLDGFSTAAGPGG